mmetsp:Transcript_25269/g.39654  ORF Transcript_25269/g.39654 Transcript_25269/m.39654 type:complete len:199 (-) Transcript_25269:37-633(-)
MELGAGLGLSSMMAAVLGAKEVRVTDGDVKALDLCQKNIEANLSPKEIQEAQLSFEQLRWEVAWDPDFNPQNPKPDVILAADVTYYKEFIPSLMRIMQRLSGPETEIWLAHYLRNDQESVNQFYKHFQVEKISEGPAFEGHPETFIFRMRYDSGKNAEVQFNKEENQGCEAGYIRKPLVNACVRGLRSLAYRDVDSYE